MPATGRGRRRTKSAAASKQNEIKRPMDRKLVGREDEMDKLLSFIQMNVKEKTGASMYVSGLPGTGKTMCVKKAVEQSKADLTFRSILVNCMNLNSANEFYSTVNGSLNLAMKGRRKRPAPGNCNPRDVEKHLTTGSSMILICLDEIDQLEKQFPTLLTRVFEWSTLPKSRVILIGIANSFDLADRCLKELNLKTDLKPQALHFRPYNTEEIVAIVKEHLSKHTDLLQPKALELCARKCAAVSGDVRRALHTCKIALDRAAARLAEGAPTTQLDESIFGTSEVLAALQATYSPMASNSRYGTLPLQQRLLFASAFSLSSAGCKQFAMEKMYEEYQRICQATHMGAIDFSEARNLCDLLQSNGLLRKISKPGQQLKYTLDISETMAREVINDDRLISAILNKAR